MDTEETLRRIAIGGDACIEWALAGDDNNLIASRLDARSYALSRIAALIAMDAAPPSYMASIDLAVDAGVTREMIVGVLVAVMPVVGVARVVSAAPKLSLALGYDLGMALEAHVGASELWQAT
jgi:alkylhydroperoxidase/carboxymuconolactone decarboxylase family protein YurZ